MGERENETKGGGGERDGTSKDNDVRIDVRAFDAIAGLITL